MSGIVYACAICDKETMADGTALTEGGYELPTDPPVNVDPTCHAVWEQNVNKLRDRLTEFIGESGDTPYIARLALCASRRDLGADIKAYPNERNFLENEFPTIAQMREMDRCESESRFGDGEQRDEDTYVPPPLTPSLRSDDDYLDAIGSVTAAQALAAIREVFGDGQLMAGEYEKAPITEEEFLGKVVGDCSVLPVGRQFGGPTGVMGVDALVQWQGSPTEPGCLHIGLLDDESADQDDAPYSEDPEGRRFLNPEQIKDSEASRHV